MMANPGKTIGLLRKKSPLDGAEHRAAHKSLLALSRRVARTGCVAESEIKMNNVSGSTDVSPADSSPVTKVASPARSTPTAQAPFPAPSPIPTQITPEGIQFDFNLGCRILLPEGDWRVRLRDLDTGNILFETAIGAGAVASAKKYYVRFGIEVWDRSQGDSVCVLNHAYDPKDCAVLVQFPVGTLGDIIGWFPYAVKFKELHGCRLTCAMSGTLIPLFESAYPDIEFVRPEHVKREQYYASYNIGLFFDDVSHDMQPCDFRHVGLHRTAGYILGVDPAEQAPRLAQEDDSRPIAERYVCIATQSTTQCKYWNHPTGWREIVQFLKAHGYRVICIDQKATHGHGIVWNHIPYGAEDQTGDLPLLERARWIKHADFFIGLGSGLSWLAWATGTPVVLISGFSNVATEFSTPYRVINYHACNSCWNDAHVRFDHTDFLWCPRHAGTSRQFECTRLITPDQVKAVLRRIPAFAELAAGRNSAPIK